MTLEEAKRCIMNALIDAEEGDFDGEQYSDDYIEGHVTTLKWCLEVIGNIEEASDADTF